MSLSGAAKSSVGSVQLLIIFVFLIHNFVDAAGSDDSLHFMEPGDSVPNTKPGLRIFCHNAKSKYIIHIWKTLVMNLRTTLETYDIYDGRTPKEVMEKHEDNQRSWRFNWFGTKRSKQMRIDPFEDTCIGIYTHPYNQFQYSMTMTQLRFDPWKVTAMALGIITFWSAHRLSKNTLFYYISGVTLGVTMSIVILSWVASKLILPKGKAMYLMLATGWTMSFWLVQALWENAQVILQQYRDWVLWYFLITSLVSFVICYRFGPVTNTRTKKIIQWFLQSLGLGLVYYSSNFREASLVCSLIMILLYNFPIAVLHKGRQYWRRAFPERRRLLTESEYRIEGMRETKKALAHLREFCSSPDCNQWKTVLRLKNPIRFAKFMEGDSDLSENESIEHDAEITRLIEECEYTNDEDEDGLLDDY